MQVNLVWFCVDTLRADHLSCYGYWRETTPTLDRLAREGVLFSGSRANAVATGPAFTSMVTGQYAINNEWYQTPYEVPDMLNFPDSRPVFPELIWDSGRFTTAAFDNLFSFRSHMKQFVRGFEWYVNCTGTSRSIHHQLVGGDLNRRLLPWLEQHKDKPLFLFVHYWDPHGPYNQPDEFARPFVHQRGSLADVVVQKAAAGYEYIPGWGTVAQLPGTEEPEQWSPPPGSPSRHPTCIDSYDGEIRYSDHLIGEVLNKLADCGMLDDTVVVINADHGEQLNQHYNCWGHPGLHEANIFTPLIMWRPGLLPAGCRPAGFVHHIDLAPTILDLLDIEPELPLDGRSLLPLIRDEAPACDVCVAETQAQRCLLRGGWKYIAHRCAPDELFDLSADPCELINLIDVEPRRAAALRAELEAWVAKHLGDRPDPLLPSLARAETVRRRPQPFL